jgi:hypothetical protein
VFSTLAAAPGGNSALTAMSSGNSARNVCAASTTPVLTKPDRHSRWSSVSNGRSRSSTHPRTLGMTAVWRVEQCSRGVFGPPDTPRTLFDAGGAPGDR